MSNGFSNQDTRNILPFKTKITKHVFCIKKIIPYLFFTLKNLN